MIYLVEDCSICSLSPKLDRFKRCVHIALYYTCFRILESIAAMLLRGCLSRSIMSRTRKVQAIATTSYTGKSLAIRECIFVQSPESAPDFRITTVKAATTYYENAVVSLFHLPSSSKATSPTAQNSPVLSIHGR